MTESSEITFFHAPQTRSGGTRALLEELGAEFDLVVLDFKTGETRKSEYLAINPMGKVPAIRHCGALVTEQPAIFLYLADLFPDARLAPPIGDALRGPYLRWMVFYGSCFEPAVVDKSLQRAPGPSERLGYGDYDTMLKTLVDTLERRPFLLGDAFSAADVLYGTALQWTTRFELVPRLPVIEAYIDRVVSRPAVQRAAAADAALVNPLPAG